MKPTKKQIETVIREMLESMKRNGFKIDSPYTLENFLTDYADNTIVWETLTKMREVEKE